jgi:L-ribulokinase
MAHLRSDRYIPIAEHQAVYDRLFNEYRILHDYFGRGGSDVMKRLKALKVEVLKNSGTPGDPHARSSQ